MRLNLLLAVALEACALVASGQIVEQVRADIAAKDFVRAQREIEAYRANSGVTPEMIEALSWMGRGALAAKHYDQAENYAQQTRKLALAALKTRKLDDERHLPLALGASIEVQAQVLGARGQRGDAVAFLKHEREAYAKTSIVTRIQKNLNLLSLEGKPAPPLEMTEWLGSKPETFEQLKGHPILLFFWAHWCGDCKGEAPELARLLAEYRSKGLILVGPTQHYGYAAGGEETTRDAETRYIDDVRNRYYSTLGEMSVPLSEQNFKNYGASTTPTLVLLDRRGIVRLYHPGAMPYAQLAAQVAKIIAD